MRHSSSNRRLWATVAAMALMTAMAGAARAEAAAAPDATVDEVIVTGTREATRTQFTTLSPVDVLSEKAIKASASSQLGDSLTQLIPSFIVQKLPTSDGLQFVRPATLRNLSPDQTLVLVNGKRFHRSAFLGSRGAQAPDLGQIPSFAVGHVEVLRDGASAQYGSDAIAGVINIILKTDPGFAGYGQASQYYKGDGATYQLGARGGMALGDGGHLAGTLEWSKADATSRTRQRPDAIAFAAAHPTLTVPNPVQRWGQPELETTRLALDAALPVGTLGEAYGFAIVGKGDGINDINWRNPDANPAIYKTTTVFPGWDLRSLYPAGFTPREGTHYKDGQIVAGLRNPNGEKLTWDLSASYGRNQTGFFLENSINASLGPNSPTSFDLGKLIQSEFNLNADGVYRLAVPALTDPLNLAFGAERRVETYQIKTGDAASYAVGPGAAVGLAPNSNGFPGFNPQQAGKWDQTSTAAYVDADATLTEAWSAQVAARYEDFSEFGDTFNGKVATRYALTPDFAFRASYSTGFRAPTPGQLNSTSTSQGLDTNTLLLFTSGRLSPTNPVAAFLGAKPLKPEESKTLSGGFTWRTDLGLSGSIDAYQIDVEKRFSTSATITVTPAIRAQLVALGVSGASAFTSINWFTNDFDTRTKGVDVVGAYTRQVGPGKLDLTAAYNYNETTVTKGALSASATQRRLFEESRPKHNATASATYALGAFELMGRARYYGAWTDSTGNSTGDIFQNFSPITFVDLAVTYKVNDHAAVRVGAENIFDTYPDEAVFQASRGLIYSRNAPYDSYGGQYYVRVDTTF
jgi:iron complex outermembrane receptor protein